MAEIIRMPRMSDTMEEGVIVEWLKKEGDEVKPGDVLAEVETDKATMELENYHEGFLLHIGVKEGAVPVNGILAVIGAKGEDYQELLATEQAKSSGNGTGENNKESAPSSEPDSIATPEPVETPSTKPPDGSPITMTSDARIKASPLAKAMAAESGIELEQVQGTGENGRIVKKDIESFLKSGKSITTEKPQIALPSVFAPNEPAVDTPVSQMRKTIAKRLGESKFSSPHFYLTIEINMDRVVSARKQVNEMAESKVSFNDFVLKACAMALRVHPAVNSSWMGDKIRQHKQINIGVAVAVDEGLLVPVINNADYKTLIQLNDEVKQLAVKAKEKKLSLEEMQGNTFTVSNLGMFGIEEFTAIINPPDACILAVGAIIKKPVVENNEIKIGNRMKVTLSCDHRVVDGATGAKFLQTLQKLMEEPVMMLA